MAAPDLHLSRRTFGVAFNNGAERDNGCTSLENGLENGLSVFF